MSHSPLKMFKQFHDKHVLVSGQGPVYDIATKLGFTHVSTVEMLRHCFTNLDMVDHRRRKAAVSLPILMRQLQPSQLVKFCVKQKGWKVPNTKTKTLNRESEVEQKQMTFMIFSDERSGHEWKGQHG